MKNKNIYTHIIDFKRKYPATIAWRLSRHCKIIDKHMNPDEKILYAFAAQKNDNPLDIVTTAVIALTNKRILIGQKRLFFGYFFTAITPDLFNDLKVKTGIIFGKVYIDTVKENVTLSNISKRAITEIETQITSYMMDEKKKYGRKS